MAKLGKYATQEIISFIEAVENVCIEILDELQNPSSKKLEIPAIKKSKYSKKQGTSKHSTSKYWNLDKNLILIAWEIRRRQWIKIITTKLNCLEAELEIRNKQINFENPGARHPFISEPFGS